MRFSAVIDCLFNSENQAKAAAKALGVELQKRARSKVSVNGNAIKIEIRANDIVALRAVANAYMRLLQGIESVEDACNEE